MNHVFFPAIWADEGEFLFVLLYFKRTKFIIIITKYMQNTFVTEAALDEALVDEIKTKLIKPLRLVKIGKWSAVGVGIFLTLTGSAYFSYLMWFKK